MRPGGDPPRRRPLLAPKNATHYTARLPVQRFHPENLRAAWWAVRTARRTRRVLAARGLDAALGPPPPPRLPAQAERGVRGALRRLHETCLVNAIVLQAWEAAHGRRRDLVVGVTGPDGFLAHAWLQGDAVPAADDAGIDPSTLEVAHGEPSATAPEASEPSRGAANGSGRPVLFKELLRRPAPDYLDRSTQIR